MDVTIGEKDTDSFISLKTMGGNIDVRNE